MRVDLSSRETRLPKIFLHREPDRAGGKPATQFANKERSGVHAGLLTVAGNCLQCRSSDRADPLLRTLSEDSNRLADRIKVPYLQPDQFRKAEPARVEELKDCLVAARHPQGSLLSPLRFRRFFEETLDLGNRQESWKAFFKFGNLDRFENVRIQDFAKDQKLVETAQRRKGQPNARARAARFHEFKKEGAKVVCSGAFPGEAWPECAEAAQGMTVARQSMRGSIFFTLQVRQELAGERVVRLGA